MSEHMEVLKIIWSNSLVLQMQNLRQQRRENLDPLTLSSVHRFSFPFLENINGERDRFVAHCLPVATRIHSEDLWQQTSASTGRAMCAGH